MKIRMKYYAQVRTAAGVEAEVVDVASGMDLAAVVRTLAERHGAGFGDVVFETGGPIRPSVMTLLNGVPVARDGSVILKDGDEVSLLSAVAGG